MFIFLFFVFFFFFFADESCPKSFNTEILNNLQKKGSRCFIQSLDELVPVFLILNIRNKY